MSGAGTEQEDDDKAEAEQRANASKLLQCHFVTRSDSKPEPAVSHLKVASSFSKMTVYFSGCVSRPARNEQIYAKTSGFNSSEAECIAQLVEYYEKLHWKGIIKDSYASKS